MRSIGIDAPEERHPERREEPFGREASALRVPPNGRYASRIEAAVHEARTTGPGVWGSELDAPGRGAIEDLGPRRGKSTTTVLGRTSMPDPTDAARERRGPLRDDRSRGDGRRFAQCADRTAQDHAAT